MLPIVLCAPESMNAVSGAPARTSAEERRVNAAPAIYRSAEYGSQGTKIRLVQYPLYYGPGWGYGYRTYGYGWGGYYGPAYAAPAYSYSYPMYSSYPVYGAWYSGYGSYPGYPIYSASYPYYGYAYGYPVYGAGYPGAYGYTYGPAVSIGFW